MLVSYYASSVQLGTHIQIRNDLVYIHVQLFSRLIRIYFQQKPLVRHHINYGHTNDYSRRVIGGILLNFHSWTSFLHSYFTLFTVIIPRSDIG